MKHTHLKGTVMIRRVLVIFSLLTALLGGAFFLFSSSVSAKGNKKNQSEIEKIIGWAQKRAVDGFRSEAQKRLVEAIKSYPQNGKEQKALLLALNQISWNFFINKAQAQYEFGEFLHYTGKWQKAEIHYQKAAKLEPENTRISVALIRNLIAQKKYRAAQLMVEQSLSIHPFDQNLRLLNLRVELCDGLKIEKLKQWDFEATNLESFFPKEVAWYRLMLADQQKNQDKVLLLAQKGLEEDKEYPEPLYLLWKHLPNSEKRKSWALEYLSRCKKNDQMFRRLYKNEPLLCVHKQDLEGALAKEVDR